MQFISAERIFTGTEWLTDHAIILQNGFIENIVRKAEVGSEKEVRHFAECSIVPALIDVQVYGAGGKLLAIYPEAETLQLMYDKFIVDGTCLFLPTLATNTIEVFKKAVDAIRLYWNRSGKGVYGLHLEGPWLNQLKRGAHVKELIHAPAVEEVRDLLEYGKGVIKMITVAPEVCSDEVISLVRSYGIVISAGHSNAKYEEALSAFDKGVSTITHLYNAMSSLQHRNPGLVGAAFNHPTVSSSVIPDGYHVDFAAIRIAKKIMGDRLFAITDAVTDTNEGYYQHQLAGDKYECNGVLSGSSLSMHRAFKNLVKRVGLEVDEALRMCSLYPAQVVGCGKEYGRIAPQAKAEFLVLDKQLEIAEVITC
ncbi:MAG: N-acetylglucosamine-6-phosphate deacetylase [Flavisolibacter sp.]